MKRRFHQDQDAYHPNVRPNVRLAQLTVKLLERFRPDLVDEVIERYRLGHYEDLATSRFPDDLVSDEPLERHTPATPTVRCRPTPFATPFVARPPHRWTKLTARDGSRLPWTLTLSDLAARKLGVYVQSEPNKELSGMGLLAFEQEPDPEQPWAATVEDLFFLSTQDTGTASTIPADSLAEILFRLLREGQDPSKLRFWFHSHARMPTFWSATDLTTIGEYLDEQQQVVSVQSGWLLSLVTNAQGDLRGRFDTWRRGGPDVAFDQIPVTLPPAPSIELDAIKEAVTRRESRPIFRPSAVKPAPKPAGRSDFPLLSSPYHESLEKLLGEVRRPRPTCIHGLEEDLCRDCNQSPQSSFL